MSCGSPHETPCTEVLSAVFMYLDHEINEPAQVRAIEVHLQECPPCGEQFEVEKRVHEVVARACCCGSDPAPNQVRDRVMQRLTELRIEMSLRGPETE